jgi:hypothetical protein
LIIDVSGHVWTGNCGEKKKENQDVTFDSIGSIIEKTKNNISGHILVWVA